jgi:DNA-binding transcriptional ArsR family regulator
VAPTKDISVTAAVFKALADSTRRQILTDLSTQELAAGELAARFPISGPSVSRHLAVLRAAGLVRERRSANKVIYSLESEPLVTEVGDFLAAVSPAPSRDKHSPKKKPKSSPKVSGKNRHKDGANASHEP